MFFFNFFECMHTKKKSQANLQVDKIQFDLILNCDLKYGKCLNAITLIKLYKNYHCGIV